MKTLRMKFVPASLVLVLAAAACTHRSAPVPASEVVRGVHVIQAGTRKLPDVVEAVGTVQAVESATLSAQVMGTVATVLVHEGDHVRAGQVLMTLDAAELTSRAEQAKASATAAQEQIAAAESDAALATATLKRYEQLRAQKSVSPQEFDEVETRARAADAHVAALRAQAAAASAAASSAGTMRGYTRIRAPFDGVVTARRADPGAMAAPGVPLLTVEKGGALQLEASVDESLLPSLKQSTSIPVLIPALQDAPLAGKVSRIVPAADPGSHSFTVKIDLPVMSGLYSGMYGRAQVHRAQEREVLVVPRSAVVTHGSMQCVFVVGANQVAEVRYITTGGVDGDAVLVLSGLSAGETIVDAPQGREVGGKRIEVGQ